MLNEKAIQGILNSLPEKKYNSFLNAVADNEEVWVLTLPNSQSFAMDDDGHILLWHYKELCEFMLTQNHNPKSIEIHDFLEQCELLESSTAFSICPSHTGLYVVPMQRLRSDIQEKLDELE